MQQLLSESVYGARYTLAIVLCTCISHHKAQKVQFIWVLGETSSGAPQKKIAQSPILPTNWAIFFRIFVALHLNFSE